MRPRLASSRPLLAVAISCFACGDDEGGPRITTADGSVVADCGGGPLSSPLAGCSPTLDALTGDPAADCVNRINQFRRECQCLPPLERWVEAESCAGQQAEYDAAGNGPHAGFSKGICKPSGFGQNECPGWGSTRDVLGGCLQSMWDEGPGEPFEEHGHYLNMSNRDYTQVACGFATDAEGGIWAVQNFR